MKLSILIPEHSRSLRLQQVIRNIREASRFHHEIVVVADRIDMSITYDYEPELVDPSFLPYLRKNKLKCLIDGSFTVADYAKQENVFSMRDWLTLHQDYLKKYDVRVEECPLHYKIEEKFATEQDVMPRDKRLRDLQEWDFGADVVVNWIMQEEKFKHDYVMVTDDDMFFLKDWDVELLKHVEEDEEEEYVYTPKVYNVKRCDPDQTPCIVCTLGAFEVRVPKESVYLDFDVVAKYAAKINGEKPEVSIEACGARRFGSMLPMVIHKRLWRAVGGRHYLICPCDDGIKAGRFIGGAEVHFDDKLGDYGVEKKLCWRSICVHTKHPLKFGD